MSTRTYLVVWTSWIVYVGCGLTAACRPDAQPVSRAAGDRDENSTPTSVTRAWVAAVERADWDAVARLYPPSVQAKAKAAMSTASADNKAKLSDAAKQVGVALAAGDPVFVEVPAVFAEPAQVEWYYCGEKPQGKYWKSPCAVSLVNEGGHWYMRDVQADSAGRSTASALDVCTKLDELRIKKTSTSTADEGCIERISWTKELDGTTLWTIRAKCILDSATLDDAYRCNKANYPEWPHASRGH